MRHASVKKKKKKGPLGYSTDRASMKKGDLGVAVVIHGCSESHLISSLVESRIHKSAFIVIVCCCRRNSSICSGVTQGDSRTRWPPTVKSLCLSPKVASKAKTRRVSPPRE